MHSTAALVVCVGAWLQALHAGGCDSCFAGGHAQEVTHPWHQPVVTPGDISDQQQQPVD